MSTEASAAGNRRRRPHPVDDGEWPYNEALLDAALKELAEQLDAAWRGEMKNVLGADVTRGRFWEAYWEPLGSSFADFACAAWDRPVFSRGGAADAVLDSVGMRKEGPFEDYINEHRPFLDVLAATQTMRILEVSPSP